MKNKLILILVVFLIIVLPINIKAANIDYGDCIKKFGTIKWVSNDSNNSAGGNINYKNKKSNNSSVTYDVIVQAPSFQKVNKVNYYISSNGDNSCTGTISGSLLNSNTGSVEFSVSIDKGYVKYMKIKGITVNRKDSSKTGSTSYEKININREDSVDSDSSNKLDDLTPTKRNAADAMKSNCDSNLKKLIEKYWGWIMFLIPLLLIALITVDFLKAVASSDADMIKKSSSNAFKRIIAAIILIMLPWMLDTIFDWFGLSICF